MVNAQNNPNNIPNTKAAGLSLFALSSDHTGRQSFLMQENDYVEPKEYLIPLGGCGGTAGFAIVDKEDYPTLIKNRWTLSDGYAVRDIILKHLDGTKDQIRISMHQQIMNTPPGYDTHHKNGIKRDNRKSNLLVCTRKEHIDTDKRFSR